MKRYYNLFLIIVVCGIVGMILAMMLNLAVTNEIISLSSAKTQQFTTLIVLMSIVLGTVIGVASSK